MPCSGLGGVWVGRLAAGPAAELRAWHCGDAAAKRTAPVPAKENNSHPGLDDDQQSSSFDLHHANNLFCSSTHSIRTQSSPLRGAHHQPSSARQGLGCSLHLLSAIMSNRKDMRRPDLSQLAFNESSHCEHADLHVVVPYVEPEQEKSDTDVACMKKSQLASQTQ